MQRFRASLRLLARSRFSEHHGRSLFSSLANNASVDDLDNQVLVEGRGSTRTAVLNRPASLNALTTAMGARLQKLYKSWEDDPDVGFVMMKGSGRAFCAGGDIVSLYRLINKGKLDDSRDFFRTLYTFIYFLGTYLKPHVALLNGVTMGGGAGVSIPGTLRVATNKTVFATPETLIGFHPDAGASFYLSHLPGHIGEYLGLTGEKLVGSEMLACGLATHYTISERLSNLEEQLGKLVTDDPSVIESSLENYADIVYPDKTSVIHRIELLDRCFGLDSVEEIIDALETEAGRTDDDWCKSTLRRLKEASPLSLKVSLRSGVRARMVNKDFTPRWDPPSLENVSKDMVDQYFSPLSSSEPELDLPTKLREAFP
ncbi:3-hydroxyisobutyryl-CoA hydrolase-like protein 1, mitochondrial isoform X2 [Punica granatum]|uniref:3-hydroxyisobutyryl-CoA hydrolase n=1 Tax=Punica granatum TaxID=22663 RepID=A0A6P8DNU4_PUNGR|nr:3-hydroxyisobutyryl-CoA hydrolase-like protein 1, mitochondrial isoform X2 [Punica granatum]